MYTCSVLYPSIDPGRDTTEVVNGLQKLQWMSRDLNPDDVAKKVWTHYDKRNLKVILDYVDFYRANGRSYTVHFG